MGKGEFRMTEKQYKIICDDFGTYAIVRKDNTLITNEIPCKAVAENILDELNALHEENQALKYDNKELINFIKSKGYTLKDYCDYIKQFASVGINKED